MPQLEMDRLVRKEVALGQVREIEKPRTFIQDQLAPFQSVDSDDVVFSYILPDTEGLAPARAEDAEAEMADLDDTAGSGRASIMDWAIKDHYRDSDVTRYREILSLLEGASGGANGIPLLAGNMTEDFQTKVARHTARRRRKLDNRLEWLAVSGAFTGAVVYNDGKIQFNVNYGRPALQQDVAPASGTWDTTASDPIGDINTMNDDMEAAYGVRMTRGYCSTKLLRQLANSDRFIARSGLVASGGTSPVDPHYLIPGWGWSAAQSIIEQATGVQLAPYDGYYNTRALGSKVPGTVRFSDERQILFMPPEGALDEISELGFGRMLGSPHSAGNWTSGFYEWERETVDPWGMDKGTGIKAFPVYPHLEYSYVMQALP